ncbi:glycosyltransferase [Sulfitobacter sp. S190]|uniref:glycosyltransferase n=1 Tax=Sulfitobacter sp. S190 TaxID=2867022 RepID=UPI0021A2E0DD|nr:glycosyltransferase [Sulfitobacter sp. S190]UWR21197.1 glycosyltransferase [Sulfitobacter sp. S190]
MMRVAILAHTRHPIAPPFKGGMEAHSWHLAKGLADRGHEVTLFASADSTSGLTPDVTLRPVVSRHVEATHPFAQFHGTEQLNSFQDAIFAGTCATLDAGAFDVIHNNSLHRFPLQRAQAIGIPMVTSLHVPPFGALQRAVQTYGSPSNRITVTSAKQMSTWWPAQAPDWATVAYNGIDPTLWPYVPGGDATAVWAGRITPNKGTDLAVRAARRAGMRLRVFGPIEDETYFDTAVRPVLSDQITYEGHVTGPALRDAFAQASLLVFTPMWDEPFGLIAAEAMATGLPVAATDMGAVREIVGPAGVIAEDLSDDALARAMTRAVQIDPLVPHLRIRRKFTHTAMIGRYEEEYENAIRAGSGPKASASAQHRQSVDLAG